jgi:hypothetical protein
MPNCATAAAKPSSADRGWSATATSLSVKFGASIDSGALTSGSWFGAIIEPEPSIRNTRLRGGVWLRSMRGARRPMSARRCVVFQGQSPIAVVTENGCSPRGSGYWKEK